MKRLLSLLLALLLLGLVCLPAAAEDLFDRSYTRFNDFAGTVSEEEEAQLNAKVRPKLGELQMDFPVCVFRTRQSTSTLEEFGADFYKRNKFGCGADKSGILLVVDLQNAKFGIYYYGEAETLLNNKAQDALSETFLTDCHNDDLTYYETFDRYYDAAFKTVEDARQYPNPEPRTQAETGMPEWYPANTEGFTDFHGENLPPVVDDARIFTNEQFQTLWNKISDMNERLGIGYAAFTSNDNYGLLPEEYSSDFLHFNGYGVGDGYGAVVFYLSLDPDDRCWLTTSINTYEPLFNADVTYEIDEMVDSSIRSGAYYEAFLMHADYVEKLFSNMTEDLPQWYPEGTKTYDLDRSARKYAAKADLQSPRIIDDAGILSAEQKQTCEQSLQALSEQYGLDLVVFTDTDYRTVYPSQYAEDFYYYNAHGADGICLYLFPKSFGTLHFGTGEKYEKLRITQRLYDTFKSGDSAKVIEDYVKVLTFVLEHDRLPMQPATAVFCFVVGLVGGLVVAAVVTGSLKSKMKISLPISTRSYLVDGSFRLFNTSHHFLYSTVTRTAIPKPSESSGSSSGGSRGGSTHTSGHSAGGSYSSGGRRF